MKIRIYFLLIILIGFLGSFSFYQIFIPIDNKNIQEKIFLVERGQGSKDIAFNLEKERLIKWAPLFRVYVFLTGVSKKLQAGAYELSSSINIPKIAEKFVLGDAIKIEVTIPEGFTIGQIEEKLVEKGLIEKSETKTSAVALAKADKQISKIYKNEFGFLKDAPEESTLEGFLFPDTYQFSYGMTSEEIIRKMLENFDRKLTIDLREEISRQKKTIFEIITMASMLEKEVKTKEDKELVSGILWKRLAEGIPLQVDATISYITGEKTTRVSKEETQIDSPYNTYKYRGLPIGPISNPGLESIMAAIYPKDSEYWYCLSTPEGETIFSRTLEEHNRAKAKYLK